MKQKVLIVDDETSIVTLLSYNIEQAGFAVDIAYDGEKAVQKALKHQFDFIILDLMLPKLDGMEVCKILRQANVDAAILMLTAKDDVIDKIIGLEIGADDYLTKPFSPREIVARIKAILRRTNKKNDDFFEVIKVDDLIIYPNKFTAEIKHKKLDFTPKEFELLVYLAKNRGLVFTRDQLLNTVWDYDFSGDTRIVDVHISRLRDKIEENTKKPSYIKTVHGIGYKLE